MGFRDLIIWILLVSTVVVNGLPRIRYESDEDVEVDLPSTSAEQGILRRIFRNSKEIDQTGFHPELETENRDFLHIDAVTGPPVPNTLEDAPDGGGANAAEGKGAGPIQAAVTPHVPAGGSSGLVEELAHIPPDGSGHRDLVTNQTLPNPIVDEDQKEAEEKEVLKEVGKIEKETDGVANSVGSDVVLVESEEQQETSNETVGASYTIDSQDEGQRPVGVPMDFFPTPLQGMNPPPFLVTKPLFGKTYVYQLRYPKLAHQSIDGEDHAGTEDDIPSGINAKNVYGPPLPVDIMKLQMTHDLELMKEGLASLPFALPRAPAGVDVGHTSPTPNIFMFFRTCPHHVGAGSN